MARRLRQLGLRNPLCGFKTFSLPESKAGRPVRILDVKRIPTKPPGLLASLVFVLGSGHGMVMATPANLKSAEAYFEHFLVAQRNQCTLCHLPSENHSPQSLEEFPHNAFGDRLRELRSELKARKQDSDIAARLALVADEDSDKDGVPNLAEVLLGAHPGDAKTKPAASSRAQLEEKTRAFEAFLARYPWQPFKPLKRPQVPAPGAPNPIDAFIQERLEVHNLKPLPDAAPAWIARRIHLDLTGLSPSPGEVASFEKDYSAQPEQAIRNLTERLLADPHYGERWGRHFMDIWRYSDWDGYKEAVRVSQPHIWRWRDWIIESLNQGKPYDRMVQEMLAGDELAPEDNDILRATGYLVRNFDGDRLQWMDNVVEHTSKAFMGLTMNCVKCHDHKYDPIPQTDYYAIRAVFEPYNVRMDPVPGHVDAAKNGMPRAYDASLEAVTYLYQRGDARFPVKDKPIAPGVPAMFSQGLEVKPVNLPLTARQPEKRDYYKAAMMAQIESAPMSGTLREWKRKTLEQQLQLEALEDSGIDKQSDTWKSMARQVAASQRQTALMEARAEQERAEAALRSATDAAAKAKTTATTKALAAAKMQAAAAAKNLKAAETAVLVEAKPEDYKPRVMKSYPASSTGRRLAFARWLTSPDNTLFARVAVNHLWLRHFGSGLVATPDDFGANGKKPTHPALLDWLATEFMASGYDLKHMHTLILTSGVYRRASSGTGAASANLKTDPDNIWYWRAPVRRMEGELVRDNLLHVAGLLDPAMGGPDIDHNTAETSRRRSLYLRHAQEKLVEFVQIFDGSRPNECYQRERSIKPHQALALANSHVTLDASVKLEQRLSRLAGSDYEAFISSGFQHILNRAPKAEESRLCTTFINQPGKDSTRLRQQLISVLFNHNDFITIR
jgi:hypothetical protein